MHSCVCVYSHIASIDLRVRHIMQFTDILVHYNEIATKGRNRKKFEEALELFEKEPSTDDITTAAIYLCRLANGKADKLSMPENEIAVSKYLTDWYRRLLVHENESAADQIVSRLDDMESVLPTAGKVLRQAVAA